MEMYEAERSQEASSRLEHAFGSRDRVGSLTHNLYRYPARFSPLLVRAALETFTTPGDLVLDPFVGGGTSAVEAYALRRRFVGTDINSLAILIARAKTQLLDDREVLALRDWLESASTEFDTSTLGTSLDVRLGNAPGDLVAGLAPFVSSTLGLPEGPVQDAARLVLLDVGQWAVEGRTSSVSKARLQVALEDSLSRLLAGLLELRTMAASTPVPQLVLGPAQDVLGPAIGGRRGEVDLVLTSPPYPGVHVLYHRWQVRGRRETGLPYWLADVRDGAGPSYYMMGSRHTIRGENVYFDTASSIWRSTRDLMRPGALAVQVIAFANAHRQLPRYLDVMAAAGYRRRPDLEPSGWRLVPNRRWFNRVKPDRATGTELLLVHQSDG